MSRLGFLKWVDLSPFQDGAKSANFERELCEFVENWRSDYSIFLDQGSGQRIERR